MRSIMRHCAPALFCLIAVASAHAQGLQRPWAACDNLSGEGGPASVVAGCTTVIDDGKSAPEGLSTAYRNRGAAYRALGDWTRSLADFGEAIRLTPRDAALFYSRGNVHASQRSYERAIAIDSRSAVLQCNYGNALQQIGRLDAAAASFERAIALNPEYTTARYALAALGCGSVPSTAPVDYVTTLFDSFADSFDKNLVDALDYQMPFVLARQFEQHGDGFPWERLAG